MAMPGGRRVPRMNWISCKPPTKLLTLLCPSPMALRIRQIFRCSRFLAPPTSNIYPFEMQWHPKTKNGCDKKESGVTKGAPIKCSKWFGHQKVKSGWRNHCLLKRASSRRVTGQSWICTREPLRLMRFSPGKMIFFHFHNSHLKVPQCDDTEVEWRRSIARKQAWGEIVVWRSGT